MKLTVVTAQHTIADALDLEGLWLLHRLCGWWLFHAAQDRGTVITDSEVRHTFVGCLQSPLPLGMAWDGRSFRGERRLPPDVPSVVRRHVRWPVRAAANRHAEPWHGGGIMRTWESGYIA